MMLFKLLMENILIEICSIKQKKKASYKIILFLWLFSHLFETQKTEACQASLSIPFPGACSNISIESVVPSNHLTLCCSLLLQSSVLPRIRAFSNKSTLHIRWPKYWSFRFSISPVNEYSGLISLGLTGLISLQSKGLSRVFSNTTVQKHQFFGTQLSL